MVRRDGSPLGNFPSGPGLGHPPIRALEYRIGTQGNRDGLAQVDAELGMASLEVVANLAEPIPGLATKRVHIVSTGISMKSRVSDADTGEMIWCTGARVRIEGGKTPLAWVDPYEGPR